MSTDISTSRTPAEHLRAMITHIEAVGLNQDGDYYGNRALGDAAIAAAPCCVLGAEMVVADGLVLDHRITTMDDRHVVRAAVQHAVSPDRFTTISQWNDSTPPDVVLETLRTVAIKLEEQGA